jgi:hypothetical protein
MINKLHVSQIPAKEATAKTCRHIIGANVATDRIWLDTTVLAYRALSQLDLRSLFFYVSNHCFLILATYCDHISNILFTKDYKLKITDIVITINFITKIFIRHNTIVQ